jgi:hypothetical protein
MGTDASNIGYRLARALDPIRFIKIFVPFINFLFLKLESRKGIDVMNYAFSARK